MTTTAKPSAILAAAAMGALLLSFPAPAAQYSKLGIITAAKSAGKWDALKSWIAASGYLDEWQAAAFFSDSYPAFAAITNAVASSGVATPAEIETILSAARDTAPDALLSAVYAAEMKTAQGRAKWHGGLPVSSFATNETTRIIERIDRYPDLWEWIDTAARRKALTPEEAARRATKRRSARQTRVKSLQSRIDALQATLAVPATNDELIVSQAKTRLEIASLQRTLDRLNAQSQTNIVTVTVTPAP